MSIWNKILLVQEGNLKRLPPLLTIISALSRISDVIVLTGIRNPEGIENLYEGMPVTFEYIYDGPRSRLGGLSKISRFLNIYTEAQALRRRVRKILKENEIAQVWVGSEQTATSLIGLLPEKSYVACAYELMEGQPLLRRSLRRFFQSAERVVVPEKTRAHILKVWLGLTHLPIVIPNKPEIKMTQLSKKRGETKTILYQGLLFDNKERNIEPFCEAVEQLYPDYELLILAPECSYVKNLCQRYKGVRYGGFITPPKHLDVTRESYIGIATYSTTSLNATFCAPNKTWEYTCFGLPLLINENPGLIGTVGAFGCAEVVKENDSDSIKSAILKINSQYETYSKNAFLFYNSISVSSIVEDIAPVSGNTTRVQVTRDRLIYPLWGTVCRGILRGIHFWGA